MGKISETKLKRLQRNLDQVYADVRKDESDLLTRGYYNGMRLAAADLGIETQNKDGKHTVKEI